MKLSIKNKAGQEHELDIRLEKLGDFVAVSATHGEFGKYYIFRLNGDGTAYRARCIPHVIGIETDDCRRIVLEGE